MAKMVALKKDELLKLLEVARSHSERDWLMILIAFNHGLRVTELVGGWSVVKRQKVYHEPMMPANFVDGFLTVKRLKGSLQTTQPLLSNQNPLLDEKTAVEKYLTTLKPTDRLFVMDRHAFAYRVRKYCREAGIARHKASPHKLKHTCGKIMIPQGIEKVRQYLGHKTIASTGAYLLTTDEEASAAFAAAMSG